MKAKIEKIKTTVSVLALCVALPSNALGMLEIDYQPANNTPVQRAVVRNIFSQNTKDSHNLKWENNHKTPLLNKFLNKKEDFKTQLKKDILRIDETRDDIDKNSFDLTPFVNDILWKIVLVDEDIFKINNEINTVANEVNVGDGWTKSEWMCQRDYLRGRIASNICLYNYNILLENKKINSKNVEVQNALNNFTNEEIIVARNWWSDGNVPNLARVTMNLLQGLFIDFIKDLESKKVNLCTALHIEKEKALILLKEKIAPKIPTKPQMPVPSPKPGNPILPHDGPDPKPADSNEASFNPSKTSSSSTHPTISKKTEGVKFIENLSFEELKQRQNDIEKHIYLARDDLYTLEKTSKYQSNNMHLHLMEELLISPDVKYHQEMINYYLHFLENCKDQSLIDKYKNAIANKDELAKPHERARNKLMKVLIETKICSLFRDLNQIIGLIENKPSSEQKPGNPILPLDDADPMSLRKLIGIGLEKIPGWELYNPPGDGNCFYHAIIHQMELMKHDFLNAIEKGTEAHIRLRQHIGGGSVGEWAENEEFRKFVQAFPDVILAVVSTIASEHGYTYYYVNDKGGVEEQFENEKPALPAKPIIKIAGTNVHYLSVLSDKSKPSILLQVVKPEEPSTTTTASTCSSTIPCSTVPLSNKIEEAKSKSRLDETKDCIKERRGLEEGKKSAIKKTEEFQKANKEKETTLQNQDNSSQEVPVDQKVQKPVFFENTEDDLSYEVDILDDRIEEIIKKEDQRIRSANYKLRQGRRNRAKEETHNWRTQEEAKKTATQNNEQESNNTVGKFTATRQPIGTTLGETQQNTSQPPARLPIGSSVTSGKNRIVSPPVIAHTPIEKAIRKNPPRNGRYITRPVRLEPVVDIEEKPIDSKSNEAPVTLKISIVQEAPLNQKVKGSADPNQEELQRQIEALQKERTEAEQALARQEEADRRRKKQADADEKIKRIMKAVNEKEKKEHAEKNKPVTVEETTPMEPTTPEENIETSTEETIPIAKVHVSTAEEIIPENGWKIFYDASINIKNISEQGTVVPIVVQVNQPQEENLNENKVKVSHFWFNDDEWEKNLNSEQKDQILIDFYISQNASEEWIGDVLICSEQVKNYIIETLMFPYMKNLYY